MDENWRTVADYEGLYEVSDLGRVRSLDRLDARNRWINGRDMQQRINIHGYPALNL